MNDRDQARKQGERDGANNKGPKKPQEHKTYQERNAYDAAYQKAKNDRLNKK